MKFILLFKMKYRKLLFLFIISFSFEVKSHRMIRKLESENIDMPNIESETIEIKKKMKDEMIIPFEKGIPFVQKGYTPQERTNNDISLEGPRGQGFRGKYNSNISNTNDIKMNNIIGTEIKPIKRFLFPSQEADKSILLLVGIGNFKMTEIHQNISIEQKVVFEVYFKSILEKTVLPFHMYVYIKITYRRIRALEETEKRDETALCDRITFQDPNIRYNCSFNMDEDVELEKVIINSNIPPSFEGMNESIAPIIYISSLANETLAGKGIQSATGNELLKTQYLMNNTVLEENDLWFKLTGEMDSYLEDQQMILFFDEKGNGTFKTAICEVNYLLATIFELYCLALKGINAHLNAIIGITITSQKKIVIYMKPGIDEFLDTGKPYGFINPKTTEIETQTNNPILDKKKLIIVLVGIGNFKMTERRPNVFVEKKVVFEVYFKQLFGKISLPFHMYVYIKIHYKRLRVIEEIDKNEEIRKKDETALCDRITFEEDTNLRYNCTFHVDGDTKLEKVIISSSNAPSFEGMNKSIETVIYISSLINEIITEKGIQTATGNELLKTQYLMNNTILEENGLKFKLTGDMDSYFQGKQIFLLFDGKGNGLLKSATCEVNNLQNTIYELDCLASRNITAYLNGVIGITSSSEEKVIIYMKSGIDEFLNITIFNDIDRKISNKKLSIVSIIIIIIVCIITLVVIVFLIFIFLKKRRREQDPDPFKETTQNAIIPHYKECRIF